jgi:hypothetical protein
MASLEMVSLGDNSGRVKFMKRRCPQCGCRKTLPRSERDMRVNKDNLPVVSN